MRTGPLVSEDAAGVLIAAVQVRLVQRQAPGGVEGVHFELLVEVRAAVRVQKHLKVVVVEDDAVVLRQGGPAKGAVRGGY